MPITAAEVEAVISLRDEMSAQLQQVQNQLTNFGQASQNNFEKARSGASGFHDMLRTATATALGFVEANVGIASVGEAFNFIKTSIIDVNDLIENTTIHLTATGMSAAAARKEVQDLMTWAGRTPFSSQQILGVAEAFQKLGGSALNTQQNLQVVVDAAAATGQGVDQLGQRFAFMYSALEAGLPISRYATQLQRSGVITGETVAKIKEAEKAHADWHVSWQLIMTDMQRFSGVANQVANAGIGTLTSRIKDMLASLTAEAFRPLFDAARTGLRAVADVLMSPQTEQFAQRTATAVASIISSIGQIGTKSGIFKDFGADLQVAAQAAGPLGDVLKDIWGTLQPLVPLFIALVDQALKNAKPLLQDVAGALREIHNHFAVIQPLLIGIVGLWLVWNTYLLVFNALTAVGAVARLAGMLLEAIPAIFGATTAMAGLDVAMIIGTGLIILIAIAIVLLVAGIYLLITHWKQVSAFLSGEWKAVSSEAIRLWGQISTAVKDAGESAIRWVQTHWTYIVGIITEAWLRVVAIVKNVGGQILNAISTAWNAIVSVLTVVGRAIYLVMVLPYAIAWAAIKLIWDAIGPYVSAKLNELRDIIAAIFNAINTTIIQPVLRAISNFINTEITGWRIIIETILHAITDFIKTEVTGWEIIFNTVWNAITTSTQFLWSNVIYPIWSTILNFLTDIWRRLYTLISSTLESIRAFVLDRSTSIQTSLSAIWGSIWNAAVNWWNSITSAISYRVGVMRDGVIGIAQGLASTLNSIWNGVANGFYNILRPVRNALNTFIGAMKSFPGLGWLPNLPAFAQGGVLSGEALRNARGAGGGFLTNRPTVLVGEGGSYPEYVIPTDPRFRGQAGALYNKLGSALGAQYLPSDQMGQGYSSYVTGGPGTWGGQCVVYVEAMTGRYFPVAYAKQMAAYVNASTPLPGDVGVTGSFAGSPFGHTFIYLGDNKVIDSNWVGPETVGIHALSGIPNIAGYIRYGYPRRNSLVASYGYGNSPYVGGGFDPVGMLKGAWSAAARGLSGDSAKVMSALFGYVFGGDIMGWIGSHMKLFDRGGMLASGQLGANMSGSPEYVFTQAQLAGLGVGGYGGRPGPVTLIIELDSREIGHAVFPHLTREIRLRTGVHS